MLVGSVSCVGLFTPGFYSLESLNWQAQSIGQDIVNLFLVNPVLLICAAMAYGGNRIARYIWGGTNLYLVYTFAIYSFDVHFNSLFFFYCLSLGLAFYSVFYFIYTEILHSKNERELLTSTDKIIGVYFIATSILFYVLWLSDILSALVFHMLPESLSSAGLPTNPVYVIDLSVILPGLFMTGWLLFRRHRLGFILAPAMLVFTLLMNLTIGGLNFVMHDQGLEVNWIVTAVMFGLAAFNFILLTQYWKAQHHGQATLHAT